MKTLFKLKPFFIIMPIAILFIGFYYAVIKTSIPTGEGISGAISGNWETIGTTCLQLGQIWLIVGIVLYIVVMLVEIGVERAEKEAALLEEKDNRMHN